jgi:hypothetical protein
MWIALPRRVVLSLTVSGALLSVIRLLRIA